MDAFPVDAVCALGTADKGTPTKESEIVSWDGCTDAVAYSSKDALSESVLGPMSVVAPFCVVAEDASTMKELDRNGLGMSVIGSAC